MRVRVLVCDTAVVIFHYVVGDAPSRFVGVRVGLNSNDVCVLVASAPKHT